MGILLLFNDNEALEYSEIQKATKLANEILEPNLSILLKAKVLLASPDSAKPAPGVSFSLNYNFKNKKIKVNLNIQIKSEQKHEADDTHKTIEEDRKLLLQSAIVRIMKSRKKMRHVQLVQEVIQQVKARFPPKIPDIKKNIEALMEKDYIERLEGDELAYIAWVFWLLSQNQIFDLLLTFPYCVFSENLRYLKRGSQIAYVVSNTIHIPDTFNGRFQISYIPPPPLVSARLRASSFVFPSLIQLYVNEGFKKISILGYLLRSHGELGN